MVEMTGRIGQDIGPSTRWVMMAELKRLGINVMKGTKVVGLRPDGLEIESAEGSAFLEADSVVIALGSRSENSLVDKIRPLVPELHVIGDAKETRRVLEAIREGFLTGLEIPTAASA